MLSTSEMLLCLPVYLVVEVDAVPVDPLHVRGGVVGGDEAGGVPGAARGELQLVHQHHAPPPPRQVVSRGHAHHAPAHHHRVRSVMPAPCTVTGGIVTFAVKKSSLSKRIMSPEDNNTCYTAGKI